MARSSVARTDSALPKTDAELLFASSLDANMRYASGFLAGDPFLYVGVRGRKVLAVSTLEIDRAKRQAPVDRVVAIADVEARLRSPRRKTVPYSMIVADLLRELRVKSVAVPSNFPLLLADSLRRRGILVFPRPEPFFPRRVVKRAEEVRAIAEAVRITEDALAGAIRLIASARIANGRLWRNGTPLTAEDVKRYLAERLIGDELVAAETIVACGDQACDPHDRGSGPLKPDQAIVLDVFPRSAQSGYWADMTRTVVRGRPSSALQNVYAAVVLAQQRAVRAVRGGVTGGEVHEVVEKTFAEAGFKTEKKNGRWQGYFHGTGHGVGLDLHELPKVGRNAGPLPVGAAITIEPGLYYPGIGGVRIEDLVVVQKGGCQNLNRLPKTFVV